MNPIISAIAIAIANLLVHGLVLSAFSHSDSLVVIGICYAIAVLDLAALVNLVAGALNIFKGKEMYSSSSMGQMPTKYPLCQCEDCQNARRQISEQKTKSGAADRLRKMSEEDEE